MASLEPSRPKAALSGPPSPVPSQAMAKACFDLARPPLSCRGTMGTAARGQSSLLQPLRTSSSVQVFCKLSHNVSLVKFSFSHLEKELRITTAGFKLTVAYVFFNRG